MRLPRLTDAAGVRRRLALFETRFTAAGTTVFYRPTTFGPPVRLSEAEAADLIAAMRATLVEADGRNPPWAKDAWPMAVAVLLLVLFTGAVSGADGIASAWALPLAALPLVGGPTMSWIRIEGAWRRGLAAAARRVAGDPDPASGPCDDAPRPNPLRPVLIAAVVGTVAIVAGLMVAQVGAPLATRTAIDRLLIGFMTPAVIVVALLALVSTAIDARYRRVSEAAIAEAMAERRKRPFR